MGAKFESMGKPAGQDCVSGDKKRVARTLRFVLIALAASCALAQAPTGEEVSLAPGLSYRHVKASTPAGEPWSIHVVSLERRHRELNLRAVAGHAAGGEMQRELPSQMGARGGALAVVNGDYDIAAPYLGISDGLSVTSGLLWTTGRAEWPVMALMKSDEPGIGVPQVTLELSAGAAKWQIAALNKPFGSVHGAGLRLYTREFRPAIKSDAAFRAIVIANLSPRLPLRVDTNVRGRVVSVVEKTNELPIPRDGIVLAWRIPEKGAAHSTSSGQASSAPTLLDTLSQLRPRTKVKLRIRVELDGKRSVREAIGGFPIIVREGRREIIGTPSDYLARRHPRTAVCYNREKIIFAVVDGRQPQLSVGMTLEELGDLMVSLGCTVAMNTDGGGSSVMAVSFPGAEGGVKPPLRIVNSPSDGQERGRGNAWVIVPKR